MGEFTANTPLNTTVNLWRNVLVTSAYTYLVRKYSARVAIPAGVALSALAGLGRGLFDKIGREPSDSLKYMPAFLVIHDPIVHTLDVALLFTVGRALSAWPSQPFPLHLGALTGLWATLRIAGLHGMNPTGGDDEGFSFTDSPLFPIIRIFRDDLPLLLTSEQKAD